MSTPVVAPDFDRLYSPLVIHIRSEVIVIALLVYEHAITFDQEVALFWMRKKTGAAWLFFAIRYLAFITFGILSAATFVLASSESCQRLQVAQYAGQAIEHLLWAAFTGLRAFAMSGMNWWVGSSVFILASSLFVGDVWNAAVGIVGVSRPLFGCNGGNAAGPQQQFIVSIVQLSCIIAADVVVILATMWYTIKNRVPQVPGIRTPLADALALNGTVYFLTFLTINAVQCGFTVISTVYALESIASIVAFKEPLQIIMTCRFMLALQAANRYYSEQGSRSYTLGERGGDGEHTLRFASLVVGSIGGELGTGRLDSAHALDEEIDDHHADVRVVGTI